MQGQTFTSYVIFYAKDNKTSLSDIPFSEERNDFGTERYVNGLIRFIEQSDAPITIALQGEWGSGKTSLMTDWNELSVQAQNQNSSGLK